MRRACCLLGIPLVRGHGIPCVYVSTAGPGGSAGLALKEVFRPYAPGAFWYRENLCVCEACYRAGLAEDRTGHSAALNRLDSEGVTDHWMVSELHKYLGFAGAQARRAGVPNADARPLCFLRGVLWPRANHAQGAWTGLNEALARGQGRR